MIYCPISGKFGMNDMIKILRDEDSGICMTGGYTSTGSQVSVIQTGTSTSPPVHWLTATPNPVISIYKPFMFCVDVDIGDITQSPHYGDSDPVRTKPRFQTVVDRKHALYEGHENLVKLLNKKKSVGARIAEKAREIENKCIKQINEKMDKQDYSNMSEIFKHACIEELALYNTN
jgi:secernin